MQEPLELEAGLYLKTLPTYARIDKTYTGVGGTTAEQLAERDSIIMMPSLNAVFEKVNTPSTLYDIEEVHGVYGGHNDYSDLVEYITSGTKFKKLYMTMSKKSIQMLRRLYGDYPHVFKYNLLLDEIDEIPENGAWRTDLSMCYNLVTKWKQMAAEGSGGSVSVISATGMDFIQHPSIKNLPYYKVSHQKGRNDFPVEVIESNDVETTLANLLGTTDSVRNFVFYNAVQDTLNLITALGIESESKVFCGNSSASRVGHLYSRDFTNFSKFNFCTSANFRSVNFNSGGKVFVVTDATSINARLSITDIVQAIGRLRTNNKKVTIIMRTKEQKNRIEQSIDTIVSFYRDIANQILGIAKAYELTGDLTEHFIDIHDEIMVDNGKLQINWAWIEGKVKERVEDRPAHESVEKLIRVLAKYDINATQGNPPKSSIDVPPAEKADWSELTSHVVSVLETDEGAKGVWEGRWNDTEAIIAESYKTLGRQATLGSKSKTDLKSKLVEYKTKGAIENVGISLANKLRPGVFYTSKEAKNILKEIYKLKGYARTAKTTDLSDFFMDVKTTHRRVEGKTARGVIVSSPIYRITK